MRDGGIVYNIYDYGYGSYTANSSGIFGYVQVIVPDGEITAINGEASLVDIDFYSKDRKDSLGIKIATARGGVEADLLTGQTSVGGFASVIEVPVRDSYNIFGINVEAESSLLIGSGGGSLGVSFSEKSFGVTYGFGAGLGAENNITVSWK